MDLLTMMYATQQIAQAYDKTLNMTLEQWNNYLDISQQELFREFTEGYLSGRGVGSSSGMDAALAPFMENYPFTSTTWTASPSGGGAFTMPSVTFNLATGVYKVLSAVAIDTTDTYPDSAVKIDIVSVNEAVERMNNSITYPTLNFPIMYLNKSGGATQFIANVMPNGFTRIIVNCLTWPPTPNLILSYANEVPSQSGSSTDLYFADPYRIDIIRIILKYLGLSVGNDQVRAFVEQQKNNEK